MDFEYKKSGQIPRFGDWDNANEMPITQYFECARQAGLVRYSSSSGEYDPYVTNGYGYGYGYGAGGDGADLYSVDYKKPSLRAVTNAHPRKKKTHNSKRWPDVKERSGQVKVRDMNGMEHPRKHQPLSHEQLMRHTNNNKNNNKSTNFVTQQPLTKVKPVDEDLYKIPPELLRKSERKRMLGFFSRCLVPPCNT